MADQQLVDQITKLTLLEAADLVKKLEEILGVSAAAAVAAAPAGGGAAAAAPVEEKTEFTVILKDAGANKINHHQGCTRSDRPRPQGSQRPRRRRPQALEGEHLQGRRGRYCQEVRWHRLGRNQVTVPRSCTPGQRFAILLYGRTHPCLGIAVFAWRSILHSVTAFGPSGISGYALVSFTYYPVHPLPGARAKEPATLRFERRGPQGEASDRRQS